MVAAIGFDLGETLLTYADTPLNWAVLYPAALAEVAAHCGARPNPAAIDRAAEILARHNTRLHPRREEIAATDIFREVLAALGIDSDRQLPAAIAAFFGFFQQRMMPYPETNRVLRILRENGVRVGVLTDVPYGMPRDFVLRDFTGAGLTDLVEVVLTSTDIGWRKPAAAGFEALARALGVAPRQLWYVGNEEKDIAGARAVGATAVLVDRAGRTPAWGQHHTVRNLDELLALL